MYMHEHQIRNFSDYIVSLSHAQLLELPPELSTGYQTTPQKMDNNNNNAWHWYKVNEVRTSLSYNT